MVNVFPIGAITKGSAGEELAAIGAMKAAGAVAITDDGLPVMNARVMRRAMEFARSFDLPVIQHCEDLNLSAGGDMHEGVHSVRLGLRGIPAASEDVMVARDILLAQLTGARYHVAHISTRNAVAMVAYAASRGPARDLRSHAASLRAHRRGDAALRQQLQDEAAAALAADIATRWSTGSPRARSAPSPPITRRIPGSEKMQEFERCPFGIIGLETAIGWRWRIWWPPAGSRWRAWWSCSPPGPKRSCASAAARWRPALPATSRCSVTDVEWTYDVNQSASRSRNSPFHGRTFRGGPMATVVDGELRWKR